MIKKLVLLTICVCLMSKAGFAQSLQAVAAVGTSTGGLCQNIQNSATTITASVSGPACGWNDGSGDFGSGSATVTADYGLLRSNSTVAATIANAAAGTNTAAQAGGNFQDSLTFPNLNMNAFLQATLSLSGSELLSGFGTTGISVNVVLNASAAQCLLQTVTGTCTTSVAVTPGSQVTISGTLIADAVAGPNAAGEVGSGSSTLNYDSKKSFGARYAFALLDSAGHKLNVPIVAASGTKYPTK